MTRTYALIVPVYRPDEWRARALAFVLERALHYRCFAEIIVAEQRAPGQPPLPLPEGVSRVVCDSDLDECHKARLVNAAAMVATADVLFVNDADIWLPWHQAIAELAKLEMFCLVQPFAHFVRLDERHTDRLVRDHLASRQGEIVRVPVAGSFAIPRGLFLLSGGFDERFVGWGQEDTELFERLRKWFPLTTLDGFVGRHLYHPRSKPALRQSAARYRHIYQATRDGDFLDIWPRVVTSIPRPRQTLAPDTVYVVCHYGTANALRNQATRDALRWLALSQDLLPRIVFAELTCGTEPQFADLAEDPRIEYLRIQGTDANGDLMQKEAIYNHVRERHDRGEAVWIFSDSDAMPLDADWIAATRQTVLDNPDAITHGFACWRDQRQTRFQVSIARQKRENRTAYPAPGFCWAVHRRYLERFPAPFWNPWLITGSGDVAFLFEHALPEEHGHVNDRHLSLAWVRSILRLHAAPKAPMAYVPRNLLHYYHGEFKDRAYVYSRVFLDHFGDVRQWVEIDANGMLAWKTPDNPVRRVCRRKPELQDSASMRRVIRECEGEA